MVPKEMIYKWAAQSHLDRRFSEDVHESRLHWSIEVSFGLIKNIEVWRQKYIEKGWIFYIYNGLYINP